MNEAANLRSHRIEGFMWDGGEISVPLVSEIAHNLWMGGNPAGTSLRRWVAILDLFGWESYPVPEEIDYRREPLLDVDSLPDVAQLRELASWVKARRQSGPVLVHCQAGLNRSGLVTALILIGDGLSPHDAIALLREKRDRYVLCNQTFERWLLTEAVS